MDAWGVDVGGQQEQIEVQKHNNEVVLRTEQRKGNEGMDGKKNSK